MDALAALRLQIEWGADEALDDAPLDRTRPAPAGRVATPARLAPGGDAHRPVAARPAVARPATLPPGAAPPAPGPPQARPAGTSGTARPASSPGLPEVAARITPGLVARATPLATPAAQAQAAADAADTPDALRAALAAFTLCPLRDTAGHLVFADNPEAGVVLIGEVPGAEEDRTGTPFAGPPGQFLDRMLASVGLDRSRLAMVMLVPWRPPGGRPPTDGEIATCLPFLLRHLALLRPRLLVPLGGLATRAVTGNSLGIRRLRGRLTESAIPGLEHPVPTLPMLHPAHLLRTPGAKREAWADLLQLRSLTEPITNP